jgi:hypothetical protein
VSSSRNRSEKEDRVGESQPFREQTYPFRIKSTPDGNRTRDLALKRQTGCNSSYLGWEVSSFSHLLSLVQIPESLSSTLPRFLIVLAANYGNASGNKEKRIFVTTPKLRTGIPVTLSTLSSKRSKDGSPLLEPFPNWDTHSEGNCDGLTSVFRVEVKDRSHLS